MISVPAEKGKTMDVREKLVELLLKEDDVCKPNECKDCGANGSCYYHRAANRIIAHGVTVQEWISVDDRLPENDVMVIGYTPCDGFMFVGYYHEEQKYDWKVWRIVTAMRSTKVMTKKVTHWMPLPPAPEDMK